MVSYTEVFFWGNDDFGQLGLGHRYQKKSEQDAA